MRPFGAAFDFVAPVTAVEVWLAGHFARLLGLTEDEMSEGSVSATASFFELGGNSLSALRLLHALRVHEDSGILGDVTVGLPDVFEHPTVAKLVAWITEQRQHNQDSGNQRDEMQVD